MKIRPSTIILDSVDKVTPNRLGVGVKLDLPPLDSPVYIVTSPGGFTSQEAALIEAECKRMGLVLDVHVKNARMVYCGHCGVELESSIIDCEERARLRVIHPCLGTMNYVLSKRPNEWEAPVFVYSGRLAYVKTSGPDNERGVICGLPVDCN